MDKSEQDKLIIDLAKIGCKKLYPDNPLRSAIAISYLVDLLEAVEKYQQSYDKVMKDFIENPEIKGWAKKIAELQNELQMYAVMARQKLGTPNRQHKSIDTNNNK